MDKLFYKLTRKTNSKESFNISHNHMNQQQGRSVSISYNINNNNGSSISISNKSCYNKYVIQKEVISDDKQITKNKSLKKIMKNPSITSISYIKNKEEIIKYK